MAYGIFTLPKIYQSHTVKFLVKSLLVFLFCPAVYSQVTFDCGNAVPICSNTPINGGSTGFGSDDFNGVSSSGCLEQTTSGSIESNSAWYQFRTAASGQLGFNIGHDSSEDWDFALYRTSDCNNLGDPIRCNFFDNSEGKSFIGVGEDPTGDLNSVHYEDWLQVSAGEDYVLFINNFSSANSGFSIQFTGDIWTMNPNSALDCSIVNNLLGPPIAACENDIVVLDASIAGAMAYEWYLDNGSGFQNISGEISPTLNVSNSGLYRVLVTTATGNIISDVQVGFNTTPITATVSDENFCHNPGQLFDLGTKDWEALGAQNPQELIISYHASQTDASLGNDPLPKQYVKNTGQETIYVRTTSLANPNCYDASQSFLLTAIETPVLSFEDEVTYCEGSGGVVIGETLPNTNFSYSWNTGENTPTITVSQEGEYTLTVSNASQGILCEASRTITVNTSRLPAISEIIIDDFKPSNTITVQTVEEGDYEYQLNDGAFQSSNVLEDVPAGVHTLTIRDSNGCGEIVEEIVVVGFPAIFSPNGDVLNESWHIEGLSALNSPVVTIYDRYGKLIAQMTEFNLGWDGNFNGQPLPSTDYWFKLSYLDNDGNRVFAKYLQSHFSLRR
ncbi:T9SS type B sorting domain-containing protein [Muricauda sp. JGD-17]|uniref:T9SS type B sorting domain-containing protein n=1 Tax=Flagellimonas ochracea TaxID=2696472 RepID=A0A964TF73_9FLAO|nr:T9SS type B sorting domain-containing protein [Allomuricauda ochracea]NAY93048.1 T9SS type B sorting domain-containing protein [Allomuricauda ochracea]